MIGDRKTENNRGRRRPPRSASPEITWEEVEDIIVDPGYSANQRKGRLKKVLTELSRRQSDTPSSETERLIEMVEKAIDQQQIGAPIAKDHL